MGVYFHIEELLRGNPENVLDKITPAEKARAQEALSQLASLVAVSDKKQFAICGFGSLLHINGDILGIGEDNIEIQKGSAQTVNGVTVTSGTIENHEIIPGISDSTGGSPTLTGLTGNLHEVKGENTDVAVFIFDAQNGFHGLRAFLTRELGGESFSPANDSEAAKQIDADSALGLYELAVDFVTLDSGEVLPALFVRTNTDSPKNPLHKMYGDIHQDPERMINFLAFQMAFGDGAEYAAKTWPEWQLPSPDAMQSMRYWEKLVETRQRLGFNNPPFILEVLGRAQEMRAMGDTLQTALENYVQQAGDTHTGIATPYLFHAASMRTR